MTRNRQLPAEPTIKNPFIRSVAVFPADGHASFGIDRIQLGCYLKSTRRRFVRPRILESAWAELIQRKAIERVRGRWVARLTASFSVSLGGEFGGDGSIAGLVHENILRRLRDRLVRAGRYPENAKAPGARDNNFLDVERIAGEFDLHQACLDELLCAVDEARALYQRALLDVFGIAVTLSEIAVSIAEIELCWDLPSPAAQSAATLWWPAWRDANRGAAIGLGRSEAPAERLLARRVEATDHRENSAVNGTGVLRADAARGGGLKFYAKHDRLLRFESELTGPRVSKLIGHRIRVDNPRDLASDLESLGRIAYKRVLAAQANLTCERTLSLGELFAAFLPDDDGDKVRVLVEAFEAGNKFHHVGRTHERILSRMQRRRLIEYQGRGIWASTSTLQRTFALVQYVTTRSRGAA